MSGVRAEAQEAGCRMPGGQVGAEFITLSNQKRLPTPLILLVVMFVFRFSESKFTRTHARLLDCLKHFIQLAFEEAISIHCFIFAGIRLMHRMN